MKKLPESRFYRAATQNDQHQHPQTSSDFTQERIAMTKLPLYQCHKQVRAAKITRIGGCGDDLRTPCLFLDLGDVGVQLPVTEEFMQKHNPQAGGYYVQYEGGYASYSPAKAFEDGYSQVVGFSISGLVGECKDDEGVSVSTDHPEVHQFYKGMDFGSALSLLKLGDKVARAGWNGKGMWLKLVPVELAETVSFQYSACEALPWIGMKTADHKFVPWLASQTDMLASDWEVVK